MPSVPFKTPNFSEFPDFVLSDSAPPFRKFITEMAPWKGDFYEGLVGLTKRNLQKAIGHAQITSVELITLLMEVR